MIAHVVFFEPRNNLSVSDKEQFLIEIRSSAKNIPSVARARIGKTVSFGVMPKQELGQTEYQYAAIFEFATQEDLQGYLVHPIHDRMRSVFWNLCQATLIADVEIFDALSAEADDLV